MADDRMFTQGEAYALVQDAILRETASLTEKAAELETQKVTLQGHIDALETEKAALVQKVADAEKAFEDYRTEQAQQKAMEERRETRLAQVAEVAPKLEITEERSGRIVAYEDEAFEGYLADLREAAAADTKGSKADKDGTGNGDPEDKGDGDGDEDGAPKSKKKGAVPRESASFRGTSPTDQGKPVKGSVAALYGASRAINKSA